MSYISGLRKIQEEAKRQSVMHKRAQIWWHTNHCPNCRAHASVEAQIRALTEQAESAMPGSAQIIPMPPSRH